MTGAYSALEDDYDAHKKRIDSFNHKQRIQEFNKHQEQKLAEAEDEELSSILATFSSAPPTSNPIIKPKQEEKS